jgi:hypothetical protein
MLQQLYNKQWNNDNLKDLKSFFPEMATCIVRDLIKSEARHGLILNPYIKLSFPITSVERGQILNIL